MSLDLVLASTSPYRRALLGRLGVPFRCRAPHFDEESFPSDGLDPLSLVESLALGKAKSIEHGEPGATIIGSDQLVSLDGAVLGKPGTVERAVEQLLAMTGRSHQLFTGLVVLHGGEVFRHVDVTTLRMRPLDRQAIERYVERDQPLDCAGSYKLEESGIVLFERIETEDHSAITGMPLIALTTFLREIGYEIP